MDRIIDHLKMTFVAEKLPPFHVFQQVAFMAAEEASDVYRLSGGFQVLRNADVAGPISRQFSCS